MSFCHYLNRIELDVRWGLLTLKHQSIQKVSSSDLGNCPNQSLEECHNEMQRQRKAQRVNSLEEIREASSKGAKVRWRHAILIERGRERAAGRGEEETPKIGVRQQVVSSMFKRKFKLCKYCHF